MDRRGSAIATPALSITARRMLGPNHLEQLRATMLQHVDRLVARVESCHRSQLRDHTVLQLVKRFLNSALHFHSAEPRDPQQERKTKAVIKLLKPLDCLFNNFVDLCRCDFPA